MFVDEHRRTKPTNILFVDEPKMFVCTLCLGGRIVLTKSEIKIFCNIETRFPGKTRHIPTPKMFGGSNETIFLHFGGLRNTKNGEN